MTPHARLLLPFALLLPIAGHAAAEDPRLDPQVPAPKEVLGHTPGEDFYLATYEETLDYFRRLADASDRVVLERVGETSYGRDWFVAIVSSPENLARRAEVFEVSRKLARAEGIDEAEAGRLAGSNPVVVHIDGGLHATEVAGAQHTPLLAHLLAARRDDPFVDRVLRDCVLVLWFSLNPDGQDMVAEWYRGNLGTPYEVSPLPFLYQKYVGHDNNRDTYMNNMLESRVLTERTLHYSPTVFYNHHQTAPFPARIWIPPFAEPVSSNVHPLVWRWTSVFGTRMATWLDERGLPGAIHRGTGFDNWYPGYVDNINNFRNSVAFLTETALYRYATPRFYPIDEFPRSRRDLRKEVFYSSPWRGGWWRLSDAVRYMLEASLAVLDTASHYRTELLLDRWRAGRDTIRRFREGPPYAYLVPFGDADQDDPATAAKLIEVLMRDGIRVHRAPAEFRANGRRYGAGTVVVRTDQAFGGLAKDLLEVQRYPEIRSGGPEGPLDVPYDVAGWTLPLQMHVTVHELAEPPDPQWLASLEELRAPPFPAGGVSGEGAVVVLPRRFNDSHRAVNALLRGGASVRVAEDGDFLVGGGDRAVVEELCRRVHVAARAQQPPDDLDALPELHVPRVGIVRPFVPSIDEGWTRWLLESFGFEPVSLRPPDVRAGGLRRRFDAIVIASIGSRTLRDGFTPGTVPPRYAGGLGDQGADALERFVREGGTLVAFDASTRYVRDLLHLDIEDPVRGRSIDEFFCSGSLLRTERATSDSPVLAGMPDEPVVMFDRSVVFHPRRGFEGEVLLRYPKHGRILRSGFLVGEDRLRGEAALVEARYGEGRAVLFGFRPQWRGQPHGTFKLLFNALWASVLPRPRAETVATTQAPAPRVRSDAAALLDRLLDEARDALEDMVAARAERDDKEAFERARRDIDGVLRDLDGLAKAETTPRRAAGALKDLAAALRLAGAEASSLDVRGGRLAAGDLWKAHRLDDLAKAAREALGPSGGGT